MLEDGVVTNCAPTLAGMKSANLFSYRYESRAEVLRELNDINKKLNARGVDACLERLKGRLTEYACFPHEIGIFLGYPLEDVVGFIAHKGKDCKLCGIWKVYGNVSEAGKLFQKLQKCSDIYIRVFQEGRSITQMTVSTQHAANGI